MENFTAESLQKFLNQSAMPLPRKDLADSHLHKHLANRKRNPSQKNLDVTIRQAMGELIRKYMEAGKIEELQAILSEHKKFIEDILHLISTKLEKK